MLVIPPQVDGGEREASPGEGVIHAGLAVPLPGDSATLGYLTVFTRRKGHEYSDEDVRQLETLALRAGPAIENARRFREARQLADLDALTGLHNRRYFHETLARECARAQRYNRRLALIVFDLDDFKAINDRFGHRGTTAWFGSGLPLLAWERGRGWAVEPATSEKRMVTRRRSSAMPRDCARAGARTLRDRRHPDVVERPPVSGRAGKPR